MYFENEHVRGGASPLYSNIGARGLEKVDWALIGYCLLSRFTQVRLISFFILSESHSPTH